MRYDVHTHAFHPKVADRILAQLHAHYGITPVGLGAAPDLLERLARAGIHRAAVHNAATAPAQVVPANEFVLGLARQHPQIIPFGTLHPADPDWEEAMAGLWRNGVRGIKLHPDFQSFRLDDPALDPIFEAGRGRFCFMLHVGDNLPPDLNPSCPFKVARILDRHPGLTAIAAHLGGYLHWRYALECLIGRDVFLDTSSSLPFLDDATLREIFRRHAPERILFGSDYPLFDPGAEAARLQFRLGLENDALERIMSSAAALFGPGADFAPKI
ncbi:MAG: amidohydrolase family protein [Thermodesulfobacteriota bacterium]